MTHEVDTKGRHGRKEDLKEVELKDLFYSRQSERDISFNIDSLLFAPDEDPWCSFTKGSLQCINGDKCKNPNHKREEYYES